MKYKLVPLLIVVGIIFTTLGAHTAKASYGGLDWVVITGPNQITATYEHSLSSYATTTYSNLGLGLTGRNITDLVATTSNTITMSFDGPPVAPNTTGSIDIGPVDWTDAPGGFGGGTAYPVDDGLSPHLGAITLQDYDNSGTLTAGDTLSFRFDEPMNDNITPENINTYLQPSNGHTFGTYANGLATTWTNSTTTLVVTIPSDATIVDGDTVAPTTAVNDVSYWHNPVIVSDGVTIPGAVTAPRTLYFYNSSDYTNWTDLSNWWTDAGHTLQATSLPNPYDDVVLDSTVSPDTSDEFYVHSLVLSPLSIPNNQYGFNVFYMNINAPGGVIADDGWDLNGSLIASTTFNGTSSAGIPFIINNNFNGLYFGLSSIVGNVTFNQTQTANYGTIYGDTTFHGQFGNAGLIYGDTEFNDSTSNPGVVFGHVTLRDNSFNGGYGVGNIHGNVDVYYPSANPMAGGADGTITYHGYAFDGGTGTSNDPYLISSCHELENIATEPTASYKLTADIDCSDSASWNANPDEWVDGQVGGTLIPDSYASTTHTDIIVQNNGYLGFEPIGTSTPFSGVFDGDGHTINNLWIFRKAESNVGLFSATQDATLKNVTLTSSNIVGGTNTGGVAGLMTNTIVSHVSMNDNMVRAYLTVNGGGLAGALVSGTLDHIQNIDGFVHGSGNVIGGIIGEMQNGTISDSNSSASVDGGLSIGGFIGQMDNGTITNSHATGSVNSNRSEYVVMKTGFYTGGFVGNILSGTITNAYATGTTTSSGDYAGGFVGYASSAAVITKAYATGNVRGVVENFNDQTFTPRYIGGFVGFAAQSQLSTTYATGNVTGVSDYTGGYGGDLESPILQNAYASGNVSGQALTGGFAGHVDTDGGEIVNAYSRGSVTGTDPATNGGFYGTLQPGATTTASFWDTQTAGQPTNGDSIEKTTAQMTNRSTFADAGWDFGTIWTQQNAVNNGYPLFLYNISPTISDVTPTVAATNVATTSSVTIDFSLPMDTGSVVISSTTCGYACGTYTQDWSNNNQTLTLTKTDGPYANAQTYSISIDSAQSVEGISLNAPYTWSFTTEAVVVPPPTPPAQTQTAHGFSGSGGGRLGSSLKFNFVVPSSSSSSNSIPVIPVTSINATTTSQCAATIYPTKDIKFGAQNDPEQVKLLEEYLNTFEHANLPVTGTYSQQDMNAVIAWQEKYVGDILTPWHLTKGTGYIYSTSLQKFKSLFLAQCPSSSTHLTSTVRILQLGMSGADVKALQQALVTKNSGAAAKALAKSGVSGYFGRLTKLAVIEFQKLVGIIPAIGNVGPITKSKLNI